LVRLLQAPHQNKWISILIIMMVIVETGTVVAQWLRYCATNRKVAGSIPDGVFGFFRWHNSSDRTRALGSTQPLTEMSTRSIWKVAGSIADGVFEFFLWFNSSDRTRVLGLTQPLTEMSPRSISWRYMLPVRRADNRTTILCRCQEIWEPKLPGTLWATPSL
jgi:hypothetical protein